MEIDVMTKDKRAISFKGEIDLTEWSLPNANSLIEDALDYFEERMEKEIKKQLEKLQKKIGGFDEYARQLASEAIQISIENGISINFWDIGGKNPDIITINFPDFCEDGFSCEVDMKKAINEVLMEACARDGYLRESEEKGMLDFAQMLKGCAHEIETAVRPKD
jgi:hypothetical protein